MRSTRVLAAALVLALTAACQETTDDGIGVDATGTVVGLAWIDRNGNTVLDGSDGPVRDVRVELRWPVRSSAVYSAVTGTNGEFIIRSVLVGDYRAVVDSGTVGDTLEILRFESASLTVAAGDTSSVAVALSYPKATTDSVRVAPVDRPFFVEGRVISEWGTFGDATLHVRDSTGALTAVRVQPTSAVNGDSIRLQGASSVQSGRPVLKDARVFILETSVQSPDPVTVTSGVAAAADGGELDAELVLTENVTIQDTLRNALGELVLRVDDRSGPLDVVLDRDIPFFLSLPRKVIGAVLDATGVLVPPASGLAGTWVLKPRETSDIRIDG